MKVYVVTEVWYSATTLVAVYANKQDALLFVIKQNKPENFEINEMEVK